MYMEGLYMWARYPNGLLASFCKASGQIHILTLALKIDQEIFKIYIHKAALNMYRAL